MFYERFAFLCEMKGVKPGRVSKETNISTATLTSWKQGKYTPKQDKLQKIADYFGVSLEFLTEKDDFIVCPECHTCYSPFSDIDISEHKKIHDKFKKACDTYGDMPDATTVRRKREECIDGFRDMNKNMGERIAKYEEFLKYDFFADVIDSGYSPTLDKEKHDFREISSLRPTYSISERLIDAIRDSHGMEPISDKTYYGDPKVAEWVQDTYDDPDMHFLSMMKKMTPERFKKFVEVMRDTYDFENQKNPE